MVDEAFLAATTGRPRPAALVLPQDVMRRSALDTAPAPAPREVPPITPEPAAILKAAAVLNRSERPVILAGGGALWSGAGREVRELATRLKAPVVTTLNGKGLLDERDPLSLGHARSARAAVVLPRADAMVAVGCRFTEVMTRWRRMPVPENLVQIDVDPGQIGMNHPVAAAVVADARLALSALAPLIEPGPSSGWDGLWEQARAARPARPEWLVETLRDVLPAESPVFTDACEIGYRMQTDYPAYGPRRFFYPSNYIALGWGFPAAVGAAVALGRTVPAVSVSGDGGFVMTAQELATASRYRLKVIAVVHNDATYGAIKNIQARNHGRRFRDVDLNNPDFPALASAYGVPATRASDPDEFREALRRAVGREGPSLIEVPDVWRKIRDGAT
jgi:acetolactate synthase-1/2/3 large subunit